MTFEISGKYAKYGVHEIHGFRERLARKVAAHGITVHEVILSVSRVTDDEIKIQANVHVAPDADTQSAMHDAADRAAAIRDLLSVQSIASLSILSHM